MCGIAGYLSPDTVSPVTLSAMSACLAHRGPDNAGQWLDPAAGIGLAHCRLSILDLSPAGHQPMRSPSGRFVIVLNGEIYNHLELRRALEPVPWRGHSDTETLLAALDAWGITATLERTVGMFAFALWDCHKRTLTLARDRFGEKPIYYGRIQKALVFASELKALRAYPGFDNAIDRSATALFLRHNYIPAPWSIYEHIWKLPPGCLVEFQAQDSLAGGAGLVRAYWSAQDVAKHSLANPFPGSEEEAIHEADRLLRQSIRDQMLADVPLGAFLSGGIDSSTVTALMQAQSSRPIKTFTIGFHSTAYNEAEHAKAVARHLGTEHTEWYLTPQDALDVIPTLAAMYDEPFADSSQIPTHLLAMLTKQHLTVALSGDGGDEFFGGYNRYFWAMALWNKLKLVPAPVRPALARVVQTLSPQTWNRVFQAMKPVLPAHLHYSNPGDKLHKLAGLFTSGNPEEVYIRLVSHWKSSDIVIGAQEPRTSLTDPTRWPNFPDFAHSMMLMDTLSYLPDDILVKVDRAAMAVSLETRVPMLDHRVFAFAWSLPLSMKIRGNQGKWLLRQVLKHYVPQSLFERPKTGFGIPLDQWLRGSLREWAENLLSANRLQQEGFFDPLPVRKKWQEHLSGRRNWSYHLWDVLMFQAWLENQP